MLFIVLVALSIFVQAAELEIDFGSNNAPTNNVVTQLCGIGYSPDVSQGWCKGCDGQIYSGGRGPVIDACGKCGGLDSTCCGADPVCSGHGSCDAEVNGCVCIPGWTGPRCQKRVRQTSIIDCGSNGQFNENTGSCRCAEGWSGSTCAAKDCGHNGHYNSTSSKCECVAGFTGFYCNECGGAPDGQVFMCAGPVGSIDFYHLATVEKGKVEIYNGKNVGGNYFFLPKGNPKFDCDCNVRTHKIDEEMVRTDEMIIDSCHAKARSTAMMVARAVTVTSEQNQDAADRAPRNAAIPVLSYGVAVVVVMIVGLTMGIIYRSA
jgi:hypothetical protein